MQPFATALSPTVLSLSALVALVAGLAIFFSATVVSQQDRAPYSAALVYLVIGAGFAVVLNVLGIVWFDPVAHADAVHGLTGVAIVIALFTTGLKLDRDVTWKGWSSIARLLLVGMPLVIGAVALLGSVLLAFSVGVAIIVAALLSPTDPVLAGEIGVGPPADGEKEREERFAVTGEAGLNDGLALVFVTLGLVLLDPPQLSFGRWLVSDVVYALAAAVAIGVGGGRALAWHAVRQRDAGRFAPSLDPFIGIGAAFGIFGLAELVAANGFVATFVGAIAFRRYRRDHGMHASVFEGLERGQRLVELVVIVLLGSTLTISGVTSIGWKGWLLVLALVFVVRPAATLFCLVGSARSAGERLFLAWFGVRGLASLYYAAAVVAGSVIGGREASRVWWLAVVTVVVSIVVHGITGSFGIHVLERRGRHSGRTDA